MSGDHYGDRFLTLTAARDSDGTSAWSVELDATGGDRDLAARMQQPWAREVLLAATNGEHSRGASSHHQQLHGIAYDGQLLWSRFCSVEDAPRWVTDGVLILDEPNRYRFEPEKPPFIVRLLDPQSGEEKGTWPVAPPPELLPAITAESSPWLSACFSSVSDHRLMVAMTIYLPGSKRNEVVETWLPHCEWS